MIFLLIVQMTVSRAQNVSLTWILEVSTTTSDDISAHTPNDLRFTCTAQHVSLTLPRSPRHHVYS